MQSFLARPLLAGRFRISSGKGSRQICRGELRASENPFLHLKIQLTYSCAQWDQHPLRSVTESWSQWGSHTHTCTRTHACTNSMTAHHCPLIKTSFHSHLHSSSPSLLHTPVARPSSSAPPHSGAPHLPPPGSHLVQLLLLHALWCLFTPHSSLNFSSRTH